MGIATLLSRGLSPAAAAAGGVAGALALVALHLLRLRRREVVVPFAPFWFGTAGSARDTRWARRLRRLLALALALTIFALVLLAAVDPQPAAADRAGRTLVILLDRSASMSARDEPGTRLGAARRRALEIIEGLRPADRALVASFAREAIAESGFESDPAPLRRAVRAVAPSEEPGDLPRALGFAAAILEGRPHPTVVLVSDGGFSEDARRAAPAGIDLRFASVGRRGRNVAIVSFAARRLPADPGAVDAALVVQNFGAVPAALVVEVTAAGTVVDRIRLALAPGERRRHALPDLAAPDARLEARLLAPDGRPLAEADGEVESSVDDLALDDHAFAVVPPLPHRRVLRVGGPDLYLDGALLGLGRTVSVDRLGAEAAAEARDRAVGYDLVIFDGVAPAPAPTAGRFLYLDPHGPGSPFAERGRVRDPVIAEARRDHPLLRNVDLTDVNIAEARRLALEPGDASVAGSFGVPLILARDRPGLRIAALSFDVRRSDLPLRPAFPLLIANALAFAAADRGEAALPRAVTTGSTLRATDGAAELAIAEVGFHHLGDELVAANLGDARESDTAPAGTLALGGRALAPPDPPARRGFVRLPALALLLAALLVMLDWVSSQRRWTT
jgi:hypothetical protein